MEKHVGKKLMSMLLMLIVAVAVGNASPVDSLQALEVAQQFQPQPSSGNRVKGQNDAVKATVVYTHMMPKSHQTAFYVVNVGESFVLVSADDVAYQVLGYGISRNFPVAKDGSVQLPPHVKAFFDDLAIQIEVAVEKSEKSNIGNSKAPLLSPQRRSGNLPASVDPLISTTWDQGQYYNALCPEDPNGPNGHVWAGCVATAMAQVVKFWANPAKGRGQHSYQSNYGKLSVDFENSALDFANMPSKLTASSTPAEVNAVANLMYQCGVAVNMGYGPAESSAFDVDARAALINFFRFSPDLSYAEKSSFTSDQWNDLLRENLAANHPVIYSGQGGNGGHTFVCDGYKADDYYHFNFGWSGAFDGWYLTSAIDVNITGYNSSQSALVGIVPDNTGHVILGQMKGTSTFTVDEPLEFYNLMGHNAYQYINYSNTCNNTVTFLPADGSKQLVADIMEFEDQTVYIYDGTGQGSQLRYLTGGSTNDLGQVVSSANALTLDYSGNMFYTGFKICLSQDNGQLRMVSNITSVVDLTSVSLMWTENGSATEWEVQYGLKGFTLGDGTVYHANTNSATFDNLEKFTEYDFYIRAVSGSQYSLWNKVTIMIEAPYWQDVITSEPEGYVVNDEAKSVEISTPEALAWWGKNGDYDAYLTADIDLSRYKWRPMGQWRNLYGQNHVISNAYMIEGGSDVGLFGDYSGTITDLGINNFYVKGKSARTGTLVGELRGTLRNCYVVNSVVDGGDYTGGLVGETDYGTIENCYVNTHVSGARWAGLLVGMSYNGKVANSYAAGSFKQRAYCYNGGIVAYSEACVIKNCYSVEMPMGVIGYKGTSVIADTATFVKADAGVTLLTPVVFDEENVTDLLTALNKGVAQINDGGWNTWKADEGNVNGGYPVFGSKHVVQCPNVSDVVIQNVKVGGNIDVSVGWTENGSATQWQIRYRRHDVDNAPYTYVSTTNNPATIQGIPVEYVYDFSVRAIGVGESKSGWSETQYWIVDKPYWTDVVTEKPSGYVEDTDGNVTVSTVEGLAWLAVKVNGLHNQEPDNFAGKTVTLTADVNLEGYRWNPIGGYINKDWLPFSGTFDGQNHRISNIYVNDGFSNKGLLGLVKNGSIKNINMVGGSVASIFTQTGQDGQSSASSAIGGLVGYAEYCKEISNCHSSVSVYGNANLGSLCGEINSNGSEVETVVSNCSASGEVTGKEGSGGLIGRVYGQVVVRNSFATGDIRIAPGGTSPWYRGGLIGNFMFASAYNCFSTGTVHTETGACNSYVAKVIGCPYRNTHIHYLYGQDDINPGWDLIGYECDDFSNASQFRHEASGNTLLTPVTVDGKTYSDMIEALNAWVTMQNDQGLRTWTLDGETGYPVFGDSFVPSCYNPTDLVVSNATEVGGATIKTRLAWNQTGEPKSWEVLYVAAEHNISEGVIVPVTSNPCVLTDIPVGKPLEFYVRAVNSETDKSYWSKPVKYIADKLHWTDVVTSQPEGYKMDDNGNVTISSAEGLAWLSSVSNGLNGAKQSNFYDKKIFIMEDIDLSAYRWTPIGTSWDNHVDNFEFYGNNHTISGMYCNDLADYMGLFGYCERGIISNLSISKCNVYGENNIGALIGCARIDIVNCTVSGNVYGIEAEGGLVGRHESGVIKNSCFVGNVAARFDITKVNSVAGYLGGICGMAFNDSIVNCYVVSEISDVAPYTGIITGTGGAPDFVGNCYYKYYETTLPITYNCNTANNSSFTIVGNKCTLSTPCVVNGNICDDLTDALSAWVDENNTDGEYRHWTDDEEGQNSSYPVFNPECYSLTYMVNGDVYMVKMLESGVAITAEPELSQEGYIFFGWSNIPATMPNHDVVITGTLLHVGDANGDGVVDIADGVEIVNYILGNPSAGFNAAVADVNGDGEITIADAVGVMNIIMNE